ncbi:MAG: hypothetical protein LBR47_04470 [Spirochaetaceae bacterium]|jgi:hypothetical protein|nr:hypothetical protein [Spirochaetaceae bacterium]
MRKQTVILFFLPFLILAAGCQMDKSVINVLEWDFSSPVLEQFSVESRYSLKFLFSGPVTVVSTGIYPVTDSGDENNGREAADAYIRPEIFSGPEGVVVLTVDAPLITGQKYQVKGMVEDERGNSLTFLLPFTGYNDRVPRLLLSEVRTEYAKPRTEFIELYTLSAGCLAGIRIFSTGDGEDMIYEFPAAEVEAGEFIVLHMRRTGDECIDEIGDSTLSGGNEAFPYARDFWLDNTKAVLPKTDVILVEERPGGALLDALLLAGEKHSAWPKAVFETAARRAFLEGVWTSGSAVSGAVVSDSATATRTFSRQGYTAGIGIPAGKDDWIVVDTGKATPGSVNSDKPYLK